MAAFGAARGGLLHGCVYTAVSSIRLMNSGPTSRLPTTCHFSILAFTNPACRPRKWESGRLKLHVRPGIASGRDAADGAMPRCRWRRLVKSLAFGAAYGLPPSVPDRPGRRNVVMGRKGPARLSPGQFASIDG